MLLPQVSHLAISPAPSLSNTLKYFTRVANKGQ
jgi:hypothetical protein